MVTINFSSAIRSATNNQKIIDLQFDGEFIELLLQLKSLFGDSFEKKILSENRVKRYVNIYINGKDYRFLNQESTVIQNSDIIDFIPAVSGG